MEGTIGGLKSKEYRNSYIYFPGNRKHGEILLLSSAVAVARYSCLKRATHSYPHVTPILLFNPFSVPPLRRISCV